MVWPPIRKRVGVVGLLQAGKSVLTASLINHLRAHDPRRLPIGDGSLRYGARELPVGGDTRRFPYDRCKEQLAAGSWPEKTVQSEEYRMLVGPVSGRGRRWDLSLVDVPGERLPDILIAEHRSYAAWSDRILELFRRHRAWASQAEPYFSALGELDRSPDEEHILAEYRRLLARLTLRFVPLVCPSAFLVEADGGYAGDRPEVRDATSFDAAVDALAHTQCSGVAATEQFAPLSREAREAAPPLARRFARRYRRYRRTVAMPFARTVRRCDELLLLMDVARLLKGGPGMAKTNEALLERLLDYVEPGGGVVHGPVQTVTRGYGPARRVQRVGFVASQADRVHPEDYGRLETLLAETARPTVDGMFLTRSFEWDCFVCAAVDSTVAGEDRTLRYRAADGSGRACTSSRLPDRWEDAADGGAYVFADPAPVASATPTVPPRHVGLDRIADFLLR